MSASSSKQPRGALLIDNLPALQNLIKRDPKAYLDEFMTQWNAYTSLSQLLQLGTGSAASEEEKWKELVGFIANVASCYSQETKGFPAQLSEILLNAQSGLQPETKRTLIHSLVLLRHRDQLSSLELMKTLFPLLGMTASPNLRSYIFKSIMSDIKEANKKSQNHKLNRTIQGFLFAMVERNQGGAVEGAGLKRSKAGQLKTTTADREAMLAVRLCSELFRKGIWTDAKTVQIVSLACFHPNTKISSAALHFFLATQEDGMVDSDEEEAELPDIKRMYHQSTINKTRRSTKKKERSIVKESHKKRKRQEAKAMERANFSALHLLLDPQDFAEKLYEMLMKNDKAFNLEHKVLIMQLFGRVTGMHKLTVLGFYTYVTRYLAHHQASVTSILVAVASSIHDLTPPDVLSPVVRKLADQFVHPGCSAEVIAAGINAIREICRRQPLAMERDLLEDLTEYKKSRDKGVMYAARSLLQLYRDVDPTLLKRRERGKTASTTGKDKPILGFGQQQTASGIEGLELLQEYKKERAAQGEEELDEEAQWQQWEQASDDEDEESEDGWINVGSDNDEDIHISDSEDEDEQSEKKAKLDVPVEEPITFELVDGSDSDSESDEDEDDEDAEDDEVPQLVDLSQAQAEQTAFENLAAQQILTPADFAKLNELRTKVAEEAAKAGGNAARRTLKELKSRTKADNGANNDHFLTESEILGWQKREKDGYAERLESIAKGREGREKFGSKKGQRKAEKHSSKTNEEKRKSKNFMMTLHSSSVRTKKSASLRDKQRKLRGHIKKQKNRMK